jgi:L-ascorbate metabolism protein UlaG (beta-lactamase superfamily)
MLRDYHRGFGGYVLRAAGHSVYHAGDSAYFAGFREIGRQLATSSGENRKNGIAEARVAEDRIRISDGEIAEAGMSEGRIRIPEGGIEVALLPIGAYSPPSFRNVHTSPEDALRAFDDLGAQWMIPMHYGSFKLSHEPMHEPLELLRDGAARMGISDRVLVLEEGRTRIFGA